MLSIMRVSDTVDIDEAIEAIEQASKVKVVSYTKEFGWYRLKLQHDPDIWTCPECGKEIHSHGHGLCLSCWLTLKKKIGAIS